MIVELSEDQERAIQAVVDWFRNGTEKQQVFRLFGPAGSGKTTLVGPIIDALGIGLRELDVETNESSGGALFATFTGKAAEVLRSKGMPAKTIHSLIYAPDPDDVEMIKVVQKQVRELKSKLQMSLTLEDPAAVKEELKAASARLGALTDPSFSPTPAEFVRGSKLIVLDEVSMVSGDVRRDLEGFGVPLLVIGDPYQLPPIEDPETAYTADPADFLLESIHRQAEGSAIIRAANHIRTGGWLAFGKPFGEGVYVGIDQLTADNCLWADQVICGKNATRYKLNNAMKNARGFTDMMPNGGDEKLIAMRNHKDTKIFNGQQVYLSEVQAAYQGLMGMVTTHPDLPRIRANVYDGHFKNSVAFDPDRLKNDFFIRKGALELDWGYALTCHKAQGSEFENVIVVNDGIGRTATEKARWLYTAITRARESVVILNGSVDAWPL